MVNTTHIRYSIAFVVLLVGVLWFVVVRAAFNPEINYQGKLTNTSDVAVNDGHYNMRFRLYTAPTGEVRFGRRHCVTHPTREQRVTVLVRIVVPNLSVVFSLYFSGM
jgi:hypothetical protein